MSLEKSISMNDEISREAAQWLVEFRSSDIDSAGRRGFDAWLRASPEHIRAFIEMAALWHESGAIDPRRELDVEGIIARDTVAMLPVEHVSPRTRSPGAWGNPGSRRARTGWWAGAAILVVLLAAGVILRTGFHGQPTYTTGISPPRAIALPDGSRALLDSKSRLRVSYTAATRTVELLQGQALFYVVRNPRRPFVVHAGHALVRDVGTVFDVNRLRDGTLVTVVEGSVAVATPSQPIYLSAGEQLEVDIRHFSPLPIHVDISSETAWTHGELVLEAATLTEVAQVFNRYSKRLLVAQDLGKDRLRLSGVFSTNPDFLIRYLRGRPDIEVTETGSEIDIVRSSPGIGR